MVRRRPMNTRPRSRNGGKARLLMAGVMIAIALISFLSSRDYNEITGETQYISMTPRQEIALGLQATPEMILQHGGLYDDPELQDYIDAIGHKLVQNSAAVETEYEYEFHLLNDEKTINAFALPGGQIFITTALYSRFSTEGQLAGVLGHEIGHVVARHSAQRIANSELTQGVIGAVVAASGSAGTAQIAQMIGQMVNMKYGREDEIQSDVLGVDFMVDAGYDPRAMITVMEILAEAGGSGGQPEFFSSHPNPDNRIGRIEDAIAAKFPGGVPNGLIE